MKTNVMIPHEDLELIRVRLILCNNFSNFTSPNLVKFCVFVLRVMIEWRMGLKDGMRVVIYVEGSMLHQQEGSDSATPPRFPPFNVLLRNLLNHDMTSLLKEHLPPYIY